PSLIGSAAAAVTLVVLTRAAMPVARQAAPAEPGAASPPPDSSEPGRNASLRVSEPPRRQVMALGAAAAGAAAVSDPGGRLLTEQASVSAAVNSLHLPAPARPAAALPTGVDLGIRGLSTFITPNPQFYRVDTAIVLPQIPPSSWQLRIHGMVSREMTL